MLGVADSRRKTRVARQGQDVGKMPENLPKLAPGKDYQLWVINPRQCK
jgi:hypothetical protein